MYFESQQRGRRDRGRTPLDLQLGSERMEWAHGNDSQSGNNQRTSLNTHSVAKRAETRHFQYSRVCITRGFSVQGAQVTGSYSTQACLKNQGRKSKKARAKPSRIPIGAITHSRGTFQGPSVLIRTAPNHCDSIQCNNAEIQSFMTHVSDIQLRHQQKLRSAFD